MITIIDILRAVSDRVEDVFGAPPTTKDVIEIADRPCTYVQGELTESVQEGLLLHETIQVEVFRYGENTRRGYLTLLEEQNALRASLGQPLAVQEGFLVWPEELEFDLQRDGMLFSASFQVETFQDLPDSSEGDLMDTLILNRKE